MSMTREEAIKHITTWMYATTDLPPAQVAHAFDMALAALRPVSREQVERMSGEWVHEPNKRSSLFYCSSCGESFNIHSYEVEKYGFCPYCGIPMTDKAVQTVMERLEAIKNG